MIQREEKPGLCVSTEKDITVGLDTVLTDELKREGIARELVSRIQNLRKEIGLEVSDRIDIFYDTESEQLKQAVSQFKDYICRETLAVQLLEEKSSEMTSSDVEGNQISLSLEKK